MATLDECRAALDTLAERMTSTREGQPSKPFDRSLSCRLSDLGTTFSGQLRDGSLHDITTDSVVRAQIRLTMTSDDLLALTAGSLSIAPAWASGRIKIDANMLDLLRMRSMF